MNVGVFLSFVKVCILKHSMLCTLLSSDVWNLGGFWETEYILSLCWAQEWKGTAYTFSDYSQILRESAYEVKQYFFCGFCGEWHHLCFLWSLETFCWTHEGYEPIFQLMSQSLLMPEYEQKISPRHEKLCPSRVCVGFMILRILQGNEMNKSQKTLFFIMIWIKNTHIHAGENKISYVK